MRLYEPVKALPPVGIGISLSKKISITGLAFVTVIACATSASAQSAPNKADSIGASAPPTTSFGAAIQAQNPLSPVYSLLNENSTNFNMGPLERTQDVLLVEPAPLSKQGGDWRPCRLLVPSGGPAHVPPVA
jgi:hypothetical protein